MKKILLNVVLVLVLGSTTNAQIKVVGDDYRDSLSGAKSYYDMDVDFDSLFPNLTPLEHRHRMEPMLYQNRSENMVGDTVYVFKDISNYVWKSTIAEQLFYSIDAMHTGYYVIKGYIWGKENMEKSGMDGRWTIKELKEMILENRLSDEGIGYYIECILLSPIDTLDVVYAVKNNYYEWNKIFCLRFYNEIRDLIGEKVKAFPYYSEFDDDIISGTVINDDLRAESLKIKDNEFIIKDVVFKEGELYLVLRGENTGSFAKNIREIRTKYGNSVNGGGGNGSYSKYYYSDIKSVYTNSDNFYMIIGISDCSLLTQRISNQKRLEKTKNTQQEQIRKQKQEKEKAEFRNRMIAKYGDGNGTLVGNRQIAIGMTKEMCKDAWGTPINTYRTTTSYGQSEVWCYNYKTRVYFYDGKVVQIDD